MCLVRIEAFVSGSAVCTGPGPAAPGQIRAEGCAVLLGTVLVNLLGNVIFKFRLLATILQLESDGGRSMPLPRTDPDWTRSSKMVILPRKLYTYLEVVEAIVRLGEISD